MKNKNVGNVNTNVHMNVKRKHDDEPCLVRKRIKHTNYNLTKHGYGESFVGNNKTKTYKKLHSVISIMLNR